MVDTEWVALESGYYFSFFKNYIIMGRFIVLIKIILSCIVFHTVGHL